MVMKTWNREFNLQAAVSRKRCHRVTDATELTLITFITLHVYAICAGW